jgi:hypothetical protein
MTITTTLPFEITEEKTVGIYQLNRDHAQYILDFHNNDNRKLCKKQVNDLYQGIKQNGWLYDGQPITFNKKGNLTEGQHRLNAIAKWHDHETTFDVIVATGIALDCFSNCVIAKPRRACDEIQRKDKTALASEVAILGDLLRRRRGDKLTINNAIRQWELWSDDIREGVDLIDTFVTNTEKFSSQSKVLGAWATLACSSKLQQPAATLLELLEEEIVNVDSTCRLTSDIINYWNTNAIDMSNEGRLTLFYQLLCIGLDRIISNEDGKIELNVTVADMHHDRLKNRGCYRKFLALC